MISYITGIVESINEDNLVVDHDGIGYRIFMSGPELQIVSQGDEVKIHTYLNVKEDSMTLFGFLEKDSLDMFKLLINVNGVGPRNAVSIIAACPGDMLQMAVATGDDKVIAQAPGVGAKTAQKVIIELKDKIDIEEVITSSSGDVMPQASGITHDAVEALVSLGYPQTQASKAVKAIAIDEEMDVEDVLKIALTNL